MARDAEASQRWTVIVLALVLAGWFATVAVESLGLLGNGFPGFFVWDNGYLASFHNADWTGIAQGLPLNGGRIASVDGAPFAGGKALFDAAAALPLGSPIAYEVVGVDGVTRSFVVPTMSFGWIDYLGTIGVYLWNALVCFVVGIAALYLRPAHLQARAFAASMTLLGLVLLLAIDLNTAYRFVPWYLLCEALLPASVFAFGLVFPTVRVAPERTRRVFGAFYTVAACFGLAGIWWYYPEPERARDLTNLVWTTIALSGLFTIGVLGHSLFAASSERERMQAAVVFTGGGVAFLFGAVGLLGFFLLGWTFSLTWAASPLFLFPLAVLYAILRHDLFEAERFIRLTLGYAVATAAVAVTYSAWILFVDRIVQPSPASGPVGPFVFLILLAVGFEPLRRSVQTGVDRFFYRSATDAARELEESSVVLASMDDPTAVRSELVQRLKTALNLEWVALRDDQEFSRREPLVEPLKFQEDVIGWVEVGPKSSGAPFSLADRELVRGLTRQAALALRNLQSLSELREAQSELLRTERLAAIGEFSRAVAHGIRNPLASIRAAAQVAGARAVEPAVAEPLADVITEADRLDDRVRALLDYSRPFEPHPVAVDLARVLAEVSDSLRGLAERKTSPSQTELRCPATLAATTDPVLLSEVLIELGANALRAMPEGGTLQLSAQRSEPGGGVEIAISDTGSGIPPGQEERIFEPFFSTRNEGSGLGLPSVRKIVEAMGGSIRLAESGPDGSVFVVALP